jgi:hypothetical protein
VWTPCPTRVVERCRWETLARWLTLCDLIAETLSEDLGKIRPVDCSRKCRCGTKVAGTIHHRRHVDNAGLDALDLTLSLVIGEEEDSLLPNWPSEGATTLILMEGRTLWREVVTRVQMGVAEEFEEIAVEVVSAGLRDDFDDAAGEAPILGIYVARKNAELGNRVKIRNDPGLLADGLLHACAVEVVGVVGLALTMNRELSSFGACGGHCAKSAARAGITCSSGSNRCDASLNCQQVGIAPSIEWNIDHLLAFDRLSDLRVGSVDSAVFSVTVIIEDACAICNGTSIARAVFTSILILLVCLYGVKPDAVTSSSYCPTGTTEKANTPSPLLVVFCVTPVAALTSVTLLPEMRAALASFTDPVILPLPV